jgi:hypothetical protein
VAARLSGSAASSFDVFAAPDRAGLVLAAIQHPGRTRRHSAASDEHDGHTTTGVFSFLRPAARGAKWSFRPSKRAGGTAFFS